jgi:hypothetical protein
MLRCTFSAVAVLNGGEVSSNYTVPAVVSQTVIYQRSFLCSSLASPASSLSMLKHTSPRSSYLCDAYRGRRLSSSHTRASRSTLVSQKQKALLLHVAFCCESYLLKLPSTTLLMLLLLKPTTWTCFASLPSWPDCAPFVLVTPTGPLCLPARARYCMFAHSSGWCNNCRRNEPCRRVRFTASTTSSSLVQGSPIWYMSNSMLSRNLYNEVA